MATHSTRTSFTHGNIPWHNSFTFLYQEKGTSTTLEHETVVLVSKPYLKREGGYAFFMPMLSGIMSFPSTSSQRYFPLYTEGNLQYEDEQLVQMNFLLASLSILHECLDNSSSLRINKNYMKCVKQK